jgi:hypothetical protein
VCTSHRHLLYFTWPLCVLPVILVCTFYSHYVYSLLHFAKCIFVVLVVIAILGELTNYFSNIFCTFIRESLFSEILGGVRIFGKNGVLPNCIHQILGHMIFPMPFLTARIAQVEILYFSKKKDMYVSKTVIKYFHVLVYFLTLSCAPSSHSPSFILNFSYA